MQANRRKYDELSAAQSAVCLSDWPVSTEHIVKFSFGEFPAVTRKRFSEGDNLKGNLT
jgi:hypothetical protein